MLVFNNLKAEMERQGLTHESMAKVVGISSKSFADKITGKQDWTLPEAKVILDYFNQNGKELTFEYLFNIKKTAQVS